MFEIRVGFHYFGALGPSTLNHVGRAWLGELGSIWGQETTTWDRRNLSHFDGLEMKT